MKKHFVRLTFIAILIAIGGSVYAQDAVTLKYNFITGKTYVQRTEVSQNIVQTMGGQEIKVLVEIKSESEFAVEGVGNDGNATVLLSPVEISVRQAAMGSDTTLNYKDLKEKSRIIYAITGKSISSTKVDSSQASSVVDQVDPGKLKILPGKPVKVGDKWQDKSVDNIKASGSTPFAVEINNDIEYSLVGKETRDGKEYYKISYSGTMAVSGKGTQMGMEMAMEGTGKTEGFCWFDPKTSMIVNSEDNTEMDTSVAISGPQNMTIPMTQSIKSTTTFEEKK